MEFTKEQVEYLKDKWLESPVSMDYRGFFNSLLKPETKFINVRIEYEGDLNLSSFLKYDPKLPSENNDTFKNIKVTELPEVFSRQDMIEFAKESIYAHRNPDYIDIDYLNYFLSERKSK